MNRDKLSDWLHCLHGGMYDWVQEEIRKELAKQEFYPDWDTLKPFHERIKELEAQLAQPEQEPVAQIRVKNGYWLETPRSIKVKSLPDGLHDLYTAPPRKELAKPEQEPVNNDYVDIHCPSCLHSFAIAPLRKEWVGLTDDEIDWILDLAYADDMELIKTIETKLKDKNDVF